MTTPPKLIEVITPPNMLKLKVGGKLGPIDEKAIARAEAALQSLSIQFQSWIEDEVEKLDIARKRAEDEGRTQASMDNLRTRAHDLKGLGTTYEYPLVTRLAGSLCKLLENPALRTQMPQKLLDAHIDAIRAAVRQKIKTDTHPVGIALSMELETRVAEQLAKVGG